MKFMWATISVSDMNASLSFYQDVIGLKLNNRMKVGGSIELAFLGAGETKIELKCDTGGGEINFGRDISLGFSTPSLHIFTELLDSRNLLIHSGPFQPVPDMKFLFIQDPDGLKIQIVEFTDKG